ncbi:MAG: NADH-quinone oxidoreductase subunit A [Planctomycetes bacterium]|nr:NADH-quinone oxidoreductase subunit A [Planctomycetota bacterium]
MVAAADPPSLEVNDYTIVVLFLALGAGFAIFNLLLAYLVHPSKPSEKDKLVAYECGEAPIGTGFVQFNMRFYVYALVFVIFDVEVVFIFPWAVVFNQMGLFAFIEMMIFIGILLIGYAYAWRKGALEWT